MRAEATAEVPPSPSMIASAVCMDAYYDIRNDDASDITNIVIDENRKGPHATLMAMTKKQLLKAAEEAAGSRAAMARVLNVAPARITELFNGTRNLSFEEGRKLIDNYGLEETSGAIRPAGQAAWEQGLALLPEFDLGYSMGGGTVIGHLDPKGVIPFQRDWLRGLISGNLNELFVARGDGDSMEPTLKDGDIVLIDTAQKDIRQQDRIWAVAWGDLGMIKRVRRHPGGSYRLMSDNQTVAPIEADDGEMHVIGRVIWIGRRI